MKKPVYKVIYDTEHDCGLMGYADSIDEAKMIGENWQAEMDCVCQMDDPEFDIEDSQNSYYVDELTEEEADKITRDDFIKKLEQSITEAVAKAWEDFDQSHEGVKLVCERRVKSIAAKAASDYFRGWNEVVHGEEEKEDSFESESETWTGRDGRP